MIQETTEKIVLIKLRIQAAQDRQKRDSGDLKRKRWSAKFEDRVSAQGWEECTNDEPLAMSLEGFTLMICSVCERAMKSWNGEIQTIKATPVTLVKVRGTLGRGPGSP
ncbi:hypothetical protein Tco_0280308 [Tanacetum coccineum]